MQKKGVIYKTTNLINGKIYIGQDSRNNPDYYGSGKLIKQSIEKNGLKNFKREILEECNLNQLNTREIFWIKKLDSTNRKKGYNIHSGGNAGNSINTKKRYGDIEYKQKITNSTIKSHNTVKYLKYSSNRQKELWKDIDFQKKVSIGIKRSRKLLNYPMLRKDWKGYVYVYDFENKLKGRYLSFSEVKRKLNMGSTAIAKCSKGNKVMKGKYKGYKFVISKDILK